MTTKQADAPTPRDELKYLVRKLRGVAQAFRRVGNHPSYWIEVSRTPAGVINRRPNARYSKTQILMAKLAIRDVRTWLMDSGASLVGCPTEPDAIATVEAARQGLDKSLQIVTELAARTANPNLVTLKEIAKLVHMEPKSMTGYVDNWPKPDIPHRGRTPMQWDRTKILPFISRDFGNKTSIDREAFLNPPP